MPDREIGVTGVRLAHCELLARLIAGDESVHVELPAALEDPEFVRLAERTKLITLVAHYFPTACEDWTRQHTANGQWIRAMLRRLDEVANAADVRVILLENGAVASQGGCHGCFSFGDLDVMTSPADRVRLDSYLRGAGFRASAGRWRTEYESGTLKLNVQPRMITGFLAYLVKEPSIDEIVQHSSGSRVLIMNPEYMLLQLCLHAASHWYTMPPGIQLYRDICWHLRDKVVDWDCVDVLCARNGSRRAVRQAMSITHRLFHIPLPIRYQDCVPPVKFDHLFAATKLRRRHKLSQLLRVVDIGVQS